MGGAAALAGFGAGLGAGVVVAILEQHAAELLVRRHDRGCCRVWASSDHPSMVATTTSNPTPTVLPAALPDETHHGEVRAFIRSEPHRQHAFGLVPPIPHEGPDCS